MGDVFISYPSENKAIADAVCHYLEGNLIKCWYAPRDIKPGAVWEDAIMEAISGSKVFVLIFSENANQSKHINNEVREAFNSQCTIIPFRVDDSKMSRTLSYYLDGIHWLDAVDPPLESNIEMLYRQVAAILDKPLHVKDSSNVAQKPKLKHITNQYSQPSRYTVKNGDNDINPFKGFLPLICVVISALLLILLLFPVFKSSQHNDTDTPQTPSTDTQAIQTTTHDDKPSQTEIISKDTETPQTQTTGMYQEDENACWQCAGSGVCARCSGTAVCYYCEASGKDCYSCGGTGECYNCGGSGNCHYCNGTGILE